VISSWLRIRGVLDRVAAAFLLVVTSPVVAVLSWRIQRANDGPGIISVERVGRDGRAFRMWKLRTMRADGIDGRSNGPALTDAEDDRITPIGRRLRAYHLDELPQLVNVVRGEMLLFGPRPESPEYVNLDDEAWRRVLRTPPGIAGPTQMIVSEWERESIASDPAGSVYKTQVLPVKLAIDNWYLDMSSPRLDLVVAVALAKRFLPGSHATRMKQRVVRELPDATAPVLAWERQATASAPTEASRSIA